MLYLHGNKKTTRKLLNINMQTNFIEEKVWILTYFMKTNFYSRNLINSVLENEP